MESKVVDKRNSRLDTTRRRRECLKCGKRFTTYEKIHQVELNVIKRNGNLELFNKEKIRTGMVRACEKRPVTIEQINSIVNKIESDLRKFKTTEIKSEQIGKKVINALKKLDNVAYLRFASVYRSFDDIKDFEKEIREIKVR